MQILVFEDTLIRLRELIEQQDWPAAVHIIDELHPADKAELFEALDSVERQMLISHLHPTSIADILSKLDEDTASELLELLPTVRATSIIAEMEPDDAADVLTTLQPELADKILARLHDPQEIHPLLLHPSDSAGGLMTSEFIALRRHMTTAEAIEVIRKWKPDTDTIYYLFVVDADNHLCGVIGLRKLITSNPQTRMVEIMETPVISVDVGTDQEACARLMSHYDLLALPVVDEQNALLGIITIDDVVDVLEDEATEDIQRFGGAEPLNHDYLSTSITVITRKRIGWLFLLFVTESLTGTVLRHFADELQAVVALSFFVPLLIGTGGNAGSQTTSTIIRALAIGDITAGDTLRSLWHETRVGLLLGLGMAVIAFGRALLWGTSQNMALTVAIAIFTIVVWANTLGAILPLIANRLHIDPTVISGPVMSTLVDATGLFIYFSLARIILHL